MRISDWSSDVCSSDLRNRAARRVSLSGVLSIRTSPAKAGVQYRAARNWTPAFAGEVRKCGDSQSSLRGKDESQPRQSHPLGLAAPQCRCSIRSEEHTSELQSLMRISYAVFCLKKKKTQKHKITKTD